MNRNLFLCLCSALTLATTLLIPERAAAQTIQVPDAFDRKLSGRLDDDNPKWINFSDCQQDDIFSWETKLTGQSSASYQVWVGKEGSDCSIAEQRVGASATCWEAANIGSAQSDQTVSIGVRKLIQGVDLPEAACGVDNQGSDTAEKINIYFLLIEGNETKAHVVWPTVFDVKGPNPPDNVQAGSGENRLVVKWNTTSTNDLLGYRIYCDVAGSTSGAAGSGGVSTNAGGNSSLAGTAGIAGASNSAGASGSSGMVGFGGTSGQAGASGSAGIGGTLGSGGNAGVAGANTGGGSNSGGSSGSTTGQGGNPNCPSVLLQPGALPPASLECGYVETAFGEQATAKGLENLVTYAVAVAAVDQAGNAGPLSEVACGTPQLVDDFFEGYQKAGGKGGGGFCSIRRTATPGSIALAILPLLGLWIRRARRSSPRKTQS